MEAMSEKRLTGTACAAICALTLALLLPAEPCSGEDPGPKAQAKRMLALRSAAKNALETLGSLAETNDFDFSEISTRLSEDMLADVKSHRTPSKSLDLTRETLKRYWLENLSAQLDRLVARAGDLSPLPIDSEDLNAQLGADWNGRRDQALRAFLSAGHQPLFDRAREKAVALQKERLSRLIDYPEFDFLDREISELQSRAGGPSKRIAAKDFDSLADQFKGQSIEQNALFEEVDAAARDLARRIGRDIQGQYEEQLKQLEKLIGNLPRSLILPDGIAEHLLAGLDEAVKPAEGPPPVYPVFSAVKAAAESRAADVSQERLESFLRSSDLDPQPDELKRIVSENPQEHRGFDQSLLKLVEIMSVRKAEDIVDEYARNSGADLSDSERALFAKMLRGDGRTAQMYRKLWSERIEPLLTQVRAAIAEEQIRKNFSLLNRSWEAGGEVAEWLYDRQKKRASGFQDVLEVLKLISDDEQWDAEPPLLEENEKRLVAMVNARAEPALAALREQLLVVDRMEKDNLDSLRSAVEQGSGYKDLIGEWRAEWALRWGQIEHDPDYDSPLPRTREQIEKTVRQLFDSVSEQIAAEQAEQTKVDSGVQASQDEKLVDEASEIDLVEEESEDDQEQEEGDILAEGVSPGFSEMLVGRAAYADFVFLFGDEGEGGCRLEFGTPDFSVKRDIDFDPAGIEDAAHAIAEAIAPDLKDIAGRKAEAYNSRFNIPLFGRGDPPELSVYVRVESRRLRHLTMLELRERLQDRLDRIADEYGISSLDIDWNEWRSMDAE